MRAILFRLVVFDLNTILDLFGLHLIQILGLGNVGKISLVFLFGVTQEVELVFFKFLNSIIEFADLCKHCIVLLFELFLLQFCINYLLLQIFYLESLILILLFFIVEMLFHISSRSNSLDRKPLFPLKLIFEIIPFIDELVVLLHRHGHLPDSIIFLLLALFSEDGFCSEHRW